MNLLLGATMTSKHLFQFAAFYRRWPSISLVLDIIAYNRSVKKVTRNDKKKLLERWKGYSHVKRNSESTLQDFYSRCLKHFQIDKEVLFEEVGASASLFPPDSLTAQEEYVFFGDSEEVDDEAKENHILTRNFILNKFYLDIRRTLTLQEDILRCIMKLKPLSSICGNAQNSNLVVVNVSLIINLFYFLESTGKINFGVLTSMNNIVYERVPGIYGDMASDPSIAVVGAGLSGLSSAVCLKKFGYMVNLVEARKRVGGRVLTVNFGSASVELGAAIVTGIIGHPVYTLAAQCGIRLNKLNASCPLVTETGIVPSDTDKKVENIWEEVLREVHDRGQDFCIMERKQDRKRKRSDCIKSAKSIDYMDTTKYIRLTKNLEIEYAEEAVSRINELVIRLKEVHRSQESVFDTMKHIDSDYNFDVSLAKAISLARKENLTALERSVFRWHESNLEYGCGTGLHKVSCLNWDQDDGFRVESSHRLVQGGMSRLCDALLHNFLYSEGTGKLFLGTEVTQICMPLSNSTTSKFRTKSWLDVSESKISLIRTRTRTKDIERELSTDACLLTVSLGILKSDIDFVPNLPKWKTNAMNNLGFGNLNKVVIQFPYKFWSFKQNFIGLVREQAKSEFPFQILNFNTLDSEAILVFLVSGNGADDISLISEKQVLREIWPFLEVIKAKGKKVPCPRSILVTDWRNDRYAKGCYSFIKEGGSGIDYDLFAEPLNDKIFFSGEATFKDEPATTSGAILSALREVGRIVNLYGRKFQSITDPKVRRFLRSCCRETSSKRKFSLIGSKLLTIHEKSWFRYRDVFAELQQEKKIKQKQLQKIQKGAVPTLGKAYSLHTNIVKADRSSGEPQTAIDLGSHKTLQTKSFADINYENFHRTPASITLSEIRIGLS